MTLLLKDNELSLRALEPSDLHWLYEVENETALWQVSDTITPFSAAILSEYIANAQLDIYDEKQLRLVIQVANAPVGLVDLFDFNPKHHRAMVGIVILPHYRNKGFGKRALLLLLSYARNVLDCHQLAATVSEDNTESRRLFTSAGFKCAGVREDWIYRDRTYINEYFYQLIF